MNQQATATSTRPSQEIQGWLVEWVARETGLPSADIDTEEQLVNYGLSSRQAVVLAGELGDWLGQDLPTSLVWDYPTIARMAADLCLPK
jgi:acyl carrier protein